MRGNREMRFYVPLQKVDNKKSRISSILTDIRTMLVLLLLPIYHFQFLFNQTTSFQEREKKQETPGKTGLEKLLGIITAGLFTGWTMRTGWWTIISCIETQPHSPPSSTATTSVQYAWCGARNHQLFSKITSID